MQRLFRLSYILLIMTFSGCSSLGSIFEEKDPTVGLTASQLYAQGKEFLDAADFNNAIKLFEILEARYPLVNILHKQCLIFHTHIMHLIKKTKQS